MGGSLRVLVVEDSEDDASLLVRHLKNGGYTPIWERVETHSAMKNALEREAWDIIISDYSMPNFSGLAALGLMRELGFDLPFIIMSGTIGEDLAVEAMQAGAHDYIMKNNPARLIPAIERELREAKVREERKQAEEMIQHLAYYDALTDLPNRALFRDRLQQAILISQREKKQVAILMLDLDRFKEINDTLGHHHGDLVLQHVGDRLRGVVRASDSIARLGGDEFGVLLPSSEFKHARLVALKILKALEPPFVIQDLPIAVEASIGIGLCPDHGSNADSLIQRADVAMYAAKEAGMGYLIYSSAHDRHSPRRLALMGELRHAIEKNQLCLYFQPKIDFDTGRTSGIESLIRWQHPVHGFIPPDQFIAPAEQTGLITPLTQWVLQEAMQKCRRLQQDGIRLKVASNLSVRNLQDPLLPRRLARALEKFNVRSECLELEITESAIMLNPSNALKVLTQLSDMGIGLCIDDFGTGYSSLGYLKKLPVGTIKIDKSFVNGMKDNENDQIIVRSIIDLGHNLGLKVVAEGVENEWTWARLADLGCDSAQGYYMSRPIPPEELKVWLRESPWGIKEGAREISR